MARNENVSIPAQTWTQITNGDVTAISFQNKGPYPIYAQATVGAVAPTGSKDNAPEYAKGLGQSSTLSDIWRGVSGANRVYVWSDAPAVVWVSHA